MTQMFTTRETPHGLRSRDALTQNVARTKRKTLGDYALKVSAPKLWNALPEDLRSFNSVKVVKAKLKPHYFNLALALFYVILLLLCTVYQLISLNIVGAI